jgi:hypothetical protein
MGEALKQDQISEEQLWQEEAAKLSVDDSPPEPTDLPPEPEPEPPAEEPKPTVEDDPYAGLHPALKAKLEKIDQLEAQNVNLTQHVKTAEGRVAAMQRQMEAAKSAQEVVAPKDAPTQAQMAAASANTEKWNQLKEDFPEWADAMEEFVNSRLSGISAGQPGLKADDVNQMLSRESANIRMELAKDLVEEAHENWQDTVKSQVFADWMSSQPQEVQLLSRSVRPRDAIRMLDLFKEATSVSADQVAQQRKAKLAAAATTKPGVTPPPRRVEDMTPDELWQYEAKQRERKRD